MRTPFLGSAYTARSKNLADQRCINLYPSIVDTKSGKDVGALYATPGLTLKGTVGNGPVRGLHTMGSTLYALSGNSFYSVTTSFASTLLGTTGTSSGPVSMIDNGTQLALFDGANGYSVAAGVMADIALPFPNPFSANYQDGLGVVNQVGSNKWWESGIFDLTKWNALDFSSADSKPDGIVSIGNLHREMFLFKENHTEVWINAGLNGFVFQRLDGVFMECGCAAAASVAVAGESLLWLGRNDQGQGVVYMATGYSPVRISTHAIEGEIASYQMISDAIGYVYQQSGHVFYVLMFPNGNATWVYDITTQLWHQRAAFAAGVFGRHRSNCYAFFANLPIVGDYINGNLYALDLSAQTDNGAALKWLRSWRALPKPVFQPTTFSSLQIDMETGGDVPAGTNPQCVLRWSDDGGHIWSNERFAAAGKTGETTRRVKFNRLGSTRLNHGLDRYFELSSSDPFKVALIGADLQ